MNNFHEKAFMYNTNNKTDTGFLNLPTEIGIQIFSNLTKEDNATASLVSKFFYTYASHDTLWENFFFYRQHIPHHHIGESKKIIAIKMTHKCIEAFAPIFFDSFTHEQLDQELVLNKDRVNSEWNELLPKISKLFMTFYHTAKKIQQMETDPNHKFLPITYKKNIFKFAAIIEESMLAIKNYSMLKIFFFNEEQNKIESIISKCLSDKKNIQDIEKVKLFLDISPHIQTCDIIYNAIWTLNAPYEVIEFLEMERIKSGPTSRCRTPEQLKVIDQILSAAKQKFKGHESEHSLLIFILQSVTPYRGGNITTRHDKENVLAVDFLREQCKQHQIDLYFYH